MHLFSPEHEEIRIRFKLLMNQINKQDENPFQFPGRKGFILIRQLFSPAY